MIFFAKNKQKFLFYHVYKLSFLFTMVAEVIKMREEEKKRPSLKFSMKRFFKKRWVLPAIYITSAAILLTAVIWFQTGGKDLTGPNNKDQQSTNLSGKKINDEQALEVNRAIENFVMPIIDPNSAVIKQQFYDKKAKAEEQEAALVFYNNQYHPNTGVNIGMEDGKTFEVVAALSGHVTKVEEDPLLGNIIEITHDEGIVTQYQSVKDMKVKIGDSVEQGQVLAKAGQSLFNEEAGVHVHFEIRKNNVPVNPLEYFEKPLSALFDDNQKEEKASEETDQSKLEDEKEGQSSEKTEKEDENLDSDKSSNKQENDSAVSLK